MLTSLRLLIPSSTVCNGVLTYLCHLTWAITFIKLSRTIPTATRITFQDPWKIAKSCVPNQFSHSFIFWLPWSSMHRIQSQASSSSPCSVHVSQVLQLLGEIPIFSEDSTVAQQGHTEFWLIICLAIRREKWGSCWGSQEFLVRHTPRLRHLHYLQARKGFYLSARGNGRFCRTRGYRGIWRFKVFQHIHIYFPIPDHRVSLIPYQSHGLSMGHSSVWNSAFSKILTFLQFNPGSCLQLCLPSCYRKWGLFKAAKETFWLTFCFKLLINCFHPAFSL